MNEQIELHIEKLVLHGFSPDQRYAIARAIEMRLARLLTEQQIPAVFLQHGIVPSINAGSIHIDNESKNEATGNKIANAVYKSFRT